MNRGIARRTVFENARDIRMFLASVARVVRAGWIEVHAYCVLTTHFHMLVRSPQAELSHAMARIQNEYVRWFNRSRRRDGPLFRGRFRSRPVDSVEYRRHLVRYIDNNSVLAGIVPTPALYPHGSARHYALRRGPPWLERDWIESVLEAHSDGRSDPQAYAEVFGEPMSAAMARLVERRLERACSAPDPLDDLVGASPEAVLMWMRRKCELADGTQVDLPVCEGDAVSRVVNAARAERVPWRLNLTRKGRCAWSSLEVGLRRQLCGESWQELAAALGSSSSAVARCYSTHLQAMTLEPDYAATAAKLAAEAIQRAYGARHVPTTFAPPTPR